MGFGKYAPVTVYAIIFVFDVWSLKPLGMVGKHVASVDIESIPAGVRALEQFRFYFFTAWTFTLQIVFLLIAVLDEASKLLHLRVGIQIPLGRARAFLFNTLVFPSSLVVVTIFWTTWHVDRELIFPKIIDTFFPWWLNHLMHTFILVPVAIELALPKKHSFIQFKDAALVLTTYLTIYQGLYFQIYYRHGVWLYGIYEVLTWTQRLAFSVFQLFLGLTYQKIGIVIQNSKRSKEIGKQA